MSIQVTESAKGRIRDVCGKEAFRIRVEGGACNGFQYLMDVEGDPMEGDERFQFDDVCVVVDMASLPFLLGSKLDYISSVVGERFEISNPNAASTCGCGTSFSV